MIGLPAGTRIWLAAGFTDMRSGFNGLAAKVQTALTEDPYSGHVFVFRDLVKVLWWTGDGLCLLAGINRQWLWTGERQKSTRCRLFRRLSRRPLYSLYQTLVKRNLCCLG